MSEDKTKAKKQRPKSKKKTATTGATPPEKKVSETSTPAIEGPVAEPPPEPKFHTVAIGSSAGGLEALEVFFRAMPVDSGMAFILVTHLDPTHTSVLPEILQRSTTMPVCAIRDGAETRPNCVYVIPPNTELSILDGSLQLMPPEKKRGANLPIDRFFRSLARDQGAHAVAIILSGTGSDGSVGLRALKEHHGMVMVQDEESSKYDGMPRSAAATGLADFVLPPDKMPEALISYVGRQNQNATLLVDAEPQIAQVTFQKICVILRDRTDHDFSRYKKNTIIRRIERRMNIHQVEDISEYVRFLQESERETRILFKELLIGVTNFFRDPIAYATLKNEILPGLLEGKPDRYTFRVWVPGCSTGEEVYSLAITLHECLEPSSQLSIQVFGTDIDEEAIEIARAGLYPVGIGSDVSAERLNRYFVRESDGTYRIKKLIREMVVFAPQSVIKDPPFTKLDLISCRNLLIYFGPELQNMLFPLFHYSLKPGGILFLGTFESIGQASDLFSARSKKWKIFQRAPVSGATRNLPEYSASSVLSATSFHKAEGGSDTSHFANDAGSGLLQLVETILSESDAPPCVIIDSKFTLVYVHGHTGKYLEPAQGQASMDVLKMARPDFRVDFGAVIRKSHAEKKEVRREGLRVEAEGGVTTFNLVAKPVFGKSAQQNMTMVTFQETVDERALAAGNHTSRGAAPTTRKIVALEQELSHTRENLQITIEELETSNEELKSTNEEQQSTNEELQSTNEELETSKEELQSLNEESTTVNAELQSRIEELSSINDDMKNLLDSTDIATIFLDTEFRVRRFTPAVVPIVPLGIGDVGRPIRHFASSLLECELAACAEKVLADLNGWEREVSSHDGRTYAVRMRPYRTVSNVIDGVVVTFHDVSELRALIESANSMASEKKFANSALDEIGALMVVLSPEGQVLRFNKKCRELTGFSEKEIVGRTYWDVLTEADAIDAEKTAFSAMKDGPFPATGSSRWLNKAGATHSIDWSYTCIRDEADALCHILGIGTVAAPPHVEGR